MAGPRAGCQPDGALHRGKLETDPAARRGDRRRRDRAEFRLSARHVGARHGLGRRPSARICRDGHALVQAGHPHAGAGEAHAERHRHPAAGPRGAARRRGRRVADQHGAIHRLGRSRPMAPTPVVDGMGTHGGYCGPAVKPIALRMVAEIARDPRMRRVADFRHRRHLHLARRRRVHQPGRRDRAGLHRGHALRLQDRRRDRATGCAPGWTRRTTRRVEDFRGRAVANFVHWDDLNLNYVTKARIDQALCIKCGLLLRGLRGHLAPVHRRQFRERRPPVRGHRRANASAAIFAPMSARSRAASRWCRFRATCRR